MEVNWLVMIGVFLALRSFQTDNVAHNIVCAGMAAILFGRASAGW